MPAVFNIVMKVDVANATFATQNITNNINKTTAAAKRATTGLKKTQSTAMELNKTLRHVFGVFAIKETLMGIVHITDAYTVLTNKLRVVSKNTTDFNKVTQATFDIANKTRSSWEATVQTYQRLAFAVKEIGASQKEMLDFTLALNQAVIIGGATSMEARAGLTQLSQGMQSGTLRGDELRSVLEQLPVVADVIANHMGITRGELRKFGSEGKISAKIVMDAFKEAGPELEKTFGKTISTMGQAWEMMKTAAINFFGAAGTGSGAMKAVVDALKWMAAHLDMIGNLVIGLAKALVLLAGMKGLLLVQKGFIALQGAMIKHPFMVLAVGLAIVLPMLDQFADKMSTAAKVVTVLGLAVSVGTVAGGLGAMGTALGVGVGILAAFTLLRAEVDHAAEKTAELWKTWTKARTETKAYTKKVQDSDIFYNPEKERELGIAEHTAAVNVLTDTYEGLKAKAGQVVTEEMNLIDRMNHLTGAAARAKTEMQKFTVGMDVTQHALEIMRIELERVLQLLNDADPSKGGVAKFMEKFAADLKKLTDQQETLQTILGNAKVDIKIDPKTKWQSAAGKINPFAKVGTSDLRVLQAYDDWEDAEVKLKKARDAGGASVVKYREKLIDYTRAVRDAKIAFFETKEIPYSEYLSQIQEAHDSFYGKAKKNPLLAQLDALLRKSNDVTKAFMELAAAEKLLSNAFVQGELFKRGLTAGSVMSDVREDLQPRMYPFETDISKIIEETATLHGSTQEYELQQRLLEHINALKDKGKTLTDQQGDSLERVLKLQQDITRQHQIEQGIMEGINGPQRKYDDTIAALKRLSADNKITPRQYLDQSHKANETFQKESDPKGFAKREEIQKKSITAYQKYRDTVSDIADTVRLTDMTVEEGIRQTMVARAELNKATDEAYEKFLKQQTDIQAKLEQAWSAGIDDIHKKMNDVGTALQDTMSTAFSNMEEFILNSVESGKLAMDDLINGMLRSLNKLTLKIIENAFIEKVAPGLGGDSNNTSKMAKDALDLAAASTAAAAAATVAATAAVASSLAALAAASALTAAKIASELEYLGAGGGDASAMLKIIGISPVLFGGSNANGGTYIVPGSGAPDSKRVMFNLTPGERVDFTPPGQPTKSPSGSAQGGQSRPSQVHVHNHFDRRELLTAIDTPEGVQQITNVINKNPGMFRAMMRKS